MDSSSFLAAFYTVSFHSDLVLWSIIFGLLITLRGMTLLKNRDFKAYTRSGQEEKTPKIVGDMREAVRLLGNFTVGFTIIIQMTIMSSTEYEPFTVLYNLLMAGGAFKGITILLELALRLWHARVKKPSAAS